MDMTTFQEELEAQVANTRHSDPYQHHWRGTDPTKTHPARFPAEVPEFFIRFLSDPGDLVLDPFGGSNMTGALAEQLQRRWVSIEVDRSFAEGSIQRFLPAQITNNNTQFARPPKPRGSNR